MDLTLLNVLRCARCGAHPLRHQRFDTLDTADGAELITGVVWCAGCMAWYPVEDGLLELLDGPLVYADDRRRFWSTHEPRLLALGLQPDRAVGTSDGPSDGASDGPSDLPAQRLQQDHFDWYADNPTQTYAQYERLPFWEARRRVVFRDWERYVKPGRRLLDIGCAHGRSTSRFVHHDLEIAAFDVAKALVREGRRRYQQERPRARVTFFVADGSRQLPFESAAFDYVVVGGVLHHLPAPALTCREIGRVLKLGGLLFSGENNRSVFRPLFDFLQRRKPLWYEQAGAHPQISRQQLEGWLTPAGFDVTIWTSVFLPPHLVNLLSPRIGAKLMALTDRLCGDVPVLRDHGGLIRVLAVKRREPPAVDG
jgi:SAM-dependent methyltransferase/uncharacterized protein YbaR (Trm112 family)